MNNKKKIIAICVCVALLAGTILSGTIAYFTDTDEIKNTFTSGNVKIDLTETCEDSEGNTVVFNETHLFPEDVYTKEPVITVESDSENAYVAAKITINGGNWTKDGAFDPDLVDANDKLDYDQLLTGGILVAENEVTDAAAAATALADASYDKDYVFYQVKEGNTFTFYVFAHDVKHANDYFSLFTTLSIPETWDHAEMAEFENFDIIVNAFATQEKNFDDCYDAITSAFPDDFNH